MKNKYDFGYEVLGLGNDLPAPDGFLAMLGAWRRMKSVESCERLGFPVGALARSARSTGGSPLSLLIVGHERKLPPEHLAQRHLRDFLDELPLPERYQGPEASPAAQAFLQGWMQGHGQGRSAREEQ